MFLPYGLWVLSDLLWDKNSGNCAGTQLFRITTQTVLFQIFIHQRKRLHLQLLMYHRCWWQCSQLTLLYTVSVIYSYWCSYFLYFSCEQQP